jgi:aminoglycoside phosphotransferase (APT) family kinase protein
MIPLSETVLPQDARELLASSLEGASVEITPVPGGASGAKIYKIGTEDLSFLLRIDEPSDGFRDAARQYACQRIAADAGVAPRLIAADVKARMSLSAFVETAAPPTREERLVALASAVRRLHAAPLFPPLMPYLDAMDIVLKTFAGAGVLPSEVLAGPLDSYARNARVYPRDAGDVVSSHNDLNPGNVLFAETGAVLIDWETAFAADRYVDVAAMLNFFAFDEAEEILVLRTYFGRAPSAGELNRVLLMRQVNRLFYAAVLIGAALRERPGLRLGAEDLVLPSLAEARAGMVSPTTFQGRLTFGCIFLNAAAHMASPAFQTVLSALESPGPARALD